MSGPDEKWINGDTGLPYWRESTAHEPRTQWVVLDGGVVAAPEPPEKAPRRPRPARAAPIPTPEPPAVPLTWRQRLVNAADALRRGDKSAMDTLTDVINERSTE